MDARQLNTIVTVGYVAIQLGIALVVSIIGAIHVRRCMQAVDLKQSIDLGANERENTDNGTRTTTDKSFCKLWIKTVWKMRGIYGAMGVHSFDVLTDILVIIKWFNEEDVDGDHIDPNIMAKSALGVLLFSKIFSTVAIYVKEGDFIRSVLQFLDLLVFREIFESHRKIVSQIKNKRLKDKKNPIESTLCFKYVRSLEAVFESIPESVLQLVYVMRTGSIEPIFAVSIIQSIVYMTNSVLNNDYTLMQDDKWEKYKQRLPPSFEFIKHALARSCEITYRIGLLALLWTVCGGLIFSIWMVVEVLIICFRVIYCWMYEDLEINDDTILLNMNSLIVIPSEDVYGQPSGAWQVYCGSDAYGAAGIIVTVIINCFCCMGLFAVVTSLSSFICGKCVNNINDSISFIPMTRISTSFLEFIFLTVWPFLDNNGDGKQYLFSFDYGISMFITSVACFLIYTQYMVLFPNFSLPFNINVRSKWGYAFSNEVSYLQRMNPCKKIPYSSKLVEKVISTVEEFWDEPCGYHDSKPITAAIFALAKENHHIVEWLAAQGAIDHKNISADRARLMLGMRDDPFIVKQCHFCKGKGRYHDGNQLTRHPCQICNGAGSLLLKDDSICIKCNGKYVNDAGRCQHCNQTGFNNAIANPQITTEWCDQVDCRLCGGKGKSRYGYSTHPCQACQQSGKVLVFYKQVECGYCKYKNANEWIGTNCSICYGTGWAFQCNVQQQ